MLWNVCNVVLVTPGGVREKLVHMQLQELVTLKPKSCIYFSASHLLYNTVLYITFILMYTVNLKEANKYCCLLQINSVVKFMVG